MSSNKSILEFTDNVNMLRLLETAKRQILESLAELKIQSIEFEVTESESTSTILTKHRYTLQHHEHFIVICGQEETTWLLEKVSENRFK